MSSLLMVILTESARMADTGVYVNMECKIDEVR